MHPGLSAEVKEAIQQIATLPREQVVVQRGRLLGKYLAAAKDLKSENEKILSSMSDEMRAVMQTKRLALMKRILADEAYPDSALVEDMVAGFSLVGEWGMPLRGVLPGKFSPASIHVDELVAGASLARDACRISTKSSGCHDIDVALWTKTLQERDKGWLVGPLEWDAVVSKRFLRNRGQNSDPLMIIR